MDRVITRSFIESANKSIDDILNASVEAINFDHTVPVDSMITDSNRVYRGKVTILFVDMRNSTQFTDDNSAKVAVKAYRSFIKMITKAVRECSGNIRDFIGDGVLAVFSDKEIEGRKVTSSEQAVSAARMISTLIDFCLNPKLKKKLKVVLGYGFGICTGTVIATKVGMRGNESKTDVENETGIIWIGHCTNYASKYCELALSGEIVIDKNTLSELSDTETWKATQKVKGDKVFDCFIAHKYYEELDTDSIPISVETEVLDEPIAIHINEMLKTGLDEYEYESRIKELRLLSEQLNKKQKELCEKEKALITFEQRLAKSEEAIIKREKNTSLSAYYYATSIIEEFWSDYDFVCCVGEKFWDKQLDNAIRAGKRNDMSEHEVKKDLCYYLYTVYSSLDSWEKAYDFLCLQAKYCSWVRAKAVKECIIHSNHCARIKTIIDARIKELDPCDLLSNLKECQQVIEELCN